MIHHNAFNMVVQRLESLERAGIRRLPKASVGKNAPPAKVPPDAASATRVESSRHTPPKEAVSERTLFSAPDKVAVAVGPWPVPVGPDDLASRTARLAAVAREVAVCTRCAELARTRTQTVFGVGNPCARLVFCGEAPGADEDRQGEPFVGRAGQKLTDIIVKGMKMRREDVYILNILRCRPPNNRNPLPVEAAACREYLDRQLEIIRPEFICCLGAVAAQNLLANEAPIGRLRGKFFQYRGAKVVCTYHPAYLLRNPEARRDVWNDIQMLMAEMAKSAAS